MSVKNTIQRFRISRLVPEAEFVYDERSSSKSFSVKATETNRGDVARNISSNGADRFS